MYPPLFVVGGLNAGGPPALPCRPVCEDAGGPPALLCRPVCEDAGGPPALLCRPVCEDAGGPPALPCRPVCEDAGGPPALPCRPVCEDAGGPPALPSPSSFFPTYPLHESLRRRVVRMRRPVSLELFEDPTGQLLSQFHAPLIERVDAPDHPLRENLVFVHRDERPQGAGRQFADQNRIARSVAFENLVRQQPLHLRAGKARGLQFGPRLRLRLPRMRASVWARKFDKSSR
jgi:hypothetical protein